MTRLLCLGDSYTIGEGVPPDLTWPRALAQMLQWDVQVIAATGWTIDELSGAMDDAEPIEPAGVVTVLIGVNDQYRGRSASDAAAALEEMLDRATSLANNRASRVVCVTIPDWSHTPFAADRDRAAIRQAIGEYNSLISATAQRRGHCLADIAPLSIGHPVVDDGLHPTAAVYASWVGGPIGAAIKSALRSTDT